MRYRSARANSSPKRSMKAALRNAGVNPDQIQYLNAHGTSTPLGDAAETKAIKQVFGDHAYKLAVSSTKSMTGHLLGAAGAVEAIFTVLALHHRLAPPTINLADLDPDVHLDVVGDKPRALPDGHQSSGWVFPGDTCGVRLPDGDLLALNNSFGFGGHNVALAIRSAS